MTDLNNYSYVDLASLQHGTQRLFHSLFVFENYPTAANPEENQTKIIFRKSIEKLDYPLGLLAYENEVLHVQLKYAGEYLTEEKAMTILKQLNIILAQIPDKINQSHQSISLLTTAEYDQIVKQWNETDTPYPKNKTLTQLFETQVEKAPNNVAVIFEERKITYRELNEKANQLANHIRKIYQHKVGRSWRPNTLIAICIERSIEMIIGILAILKAGAVYVPIDPNYPRERIQYILDDTKTELVLSRQHFDYAVDSIILDEVPYADYSVNNLEQFNNAEDLAYVIYTSGTTGKPKGVMIPHRGVVNTIAAQINSFKISNQSSVLQFASFTFDASVSEIFSALLSGAQLFVGNKERLLPGDALAETLEKYGISVATIPPTALAVTPYQRYSQLQTLIVAGEACSAEVMQSWSKTYRCINAYGPTEASICAALWIFPKDFSTPLLGKPIANVKLYVLDSALNPLPTDVTGELYITGAGLARGYLNREKLTAERFILNPFASEIDKKNNYTHLYKTGDLVRWLSDGNLEYIGRNDFQVKIRGYRIELGEIENNLMSYSLVKQAVVLLKEHSDNKYLVAYYVAKSAINSENLIRHLKKLLPEYMIPAIFIHLRTMPLTISGKIDRKALPAPEFKTDETKYVAPRNDLEEKISVIWQKLLNIKKISIHDDFFRIGGDSISSIQLTSRLKNEGIICHVKDIFEYRTIENLAKYLQSEKEIISIVAEHGNLSGSFNLLPIQQWFFSQQFTNPNYWNQSFLVYVPQLDLNKITRIISKLAAHHDVLRLTYLTDKDPVQQIYHETLPYPDLKILNCASLDNMALQKVLTEWQRDFNIKKGPLWQIGYIDGYADGSARLYFALHHLIVDTVSWHILIEDVKALYEGKTLAAKTSSYRQWVKAVEAYPQQHPQEINYWETLVEKHLPLKIKASGKPVTTEIKLSKKYTQALLQQANEAYHTEINDLLLTALAYALQTWHQRNESYITLEAHGRETIDKSLDVSRTVGWFTVAYPLQLQLQQDFANSIKNIKKILRAVPNKGIGYGAFKYLARSEKLKAHALPLISFNYLGQFNTQTEFWHLSSETAGKSADPNNQDKNLLNINGWVIAGELYFSIVSQLSESDTRKFSQSFQQYLKNIIDHCVTMIAQNKLNYTPSDFDLIQINQLYKKISSVLQSKKRKFELIIPLNEYRSQQKTLFMIHPGNASCEVYRNLADAIISKFYCYGIDNYNFYHEKSVDSLSKLAALYLKEIKRHHNKNEPYFLLGWSLGGHIALEIACLLEKEGVTDITIYLLDTILPDKKLKNAKIITTATEYIQQLENYLLSANYNAKFVQRMKSVYLAETKISNMNISTYLQHTKVILFKASKEDTEIVMRDDDKAIFRHILQTKDNNVRQYCKYLTVIRLDASHYTILQNKAIKDFFILDTKS
jgi:amino acid adenylation domain-containing protein/non-ribosomal peptide synthase protein (TIGR01720 family)